MPLLSCSAQNCMYNEDRYCGKSDILIQGDEAQCAGDTCCSSFKERGEKCFRNYSGMASPNTQIDCTACGCRHNEEKRCLAGKVDVTGTYAECCGQTECSSFEK